MTTIAFRNGIMASDSLLTEGNTIVGSVTKIKLINNKILAGAAGSWEKCCSFFDYIERRLQNVAATKPDFKGNNFSGLVAFKVGKKYSIVSYEDLLYPMPFKAPYAAIGSGRDIALGAMENGASAIEAVRHAIKLDLQTGGKVRWLQLK